MRRRKVTTGPEPYRLTPPLDRFKATKIPALVEVCRTYVKQPLDDDIWPHVNAWEAFEAMQEIHDLLEGRMPITHCWTFEVELALCLGAKETGVVVTRFLRLVSSNARGLNLDSRRDYSWMGDCLCPIKAIDSRITEGQ